MNKKLLKSLLLVTIVFFSTACSNLKSDVERLKVDQRDLRSIQAQQTSEFSILQSQLRELTGRIEQLEFNQGQKLTGELSELRQNLSYLKQRVPPPAIVPAIALEADEAYAAQLSFDGSASFGEALGLIRAGSFREAISLLERVLSITAGTKEGGYALFWRGVCFEGLNDNPRAVGSYAELTVGMPGDHPRKPLAFLRQGSVFIRMGDNKAAKATFGKLIADYPRTTEAAQARERLKDI